MAERSPFRSWFLSVSLVCGPRYGPNSYSLREKQGCDDGVSLVSFCNHSLRDGPSHICHKREQDSASNPPEPREMSEQFSLLCEMLPQNSARSTTCVQQAGAICFRTSADSLPEVLLVTSRRNGRWGIPKGRIEAGETARAAAAREAMEEAGVRGRVSSDAIGSFVYTIALTSAITSTCICSKSRKFWRTSPRGKAGDYNGLRLKPPSRKSLSQSSVNCCCFWLQKTGCVSGLNSRPGSAAGIMQGNQCAVFALCRRTCIS